MKCSFLSKDKSNCSAHAMIGSQYCYFHNPEIDEGSKKSAQSRGGKGNATLIREPLPPVSIKEAKDVVLLLEDTVNRVRAGEVEVRIGNCIGLLSGQIIKALEIAQLQNRVEIIERAILERRTRYS